MPQKNEAEEMLRKWGNYAMENGVGKSEWQVELNLWCLDFGTSTGYSGTDLSVIYFIS